MTTAISSRGKQGALLIAGILMIATTLRVTFTGAAPLLDSIRIDYGLTTAQTGMLTTLPLLAFALVSPLAAGIARRLGMERSLFTAMLLICAGIAIRSLPAPVLLFIGTAIIGSGIALGNVLLPGIIKRDYAGQIARLTGAYSLTMGAAAALGSALVVPLSLMGAGWHGALIGMTRSSDTQYDHTREERYAISPSLLWQPDSDTSLLLRAYLQKDPSGGYHGSLPLDGTRYAHNGRKLSPSTNEGDPGDGYQRRQQIYSYEFDHQFTDVWSVYSAGSYTHTNVSLDQVYQVGWIDDSDMLARGYSGSRGSLDGWSTDNRLRADFNTGDLAHTLILGAEYHRFRNDLWTGAGGAAPLNPFSGYTAQTGHTVTYSDDNNRRYYQTGLYLQDEMVWNRWHVDVSARYDRIVSQQVSDTQGTSNRRSDDHISGRASLLYALDNGLSPYLSYSQAITPAMLPGADGKPLKPTTAEQVEAGLKFQPPGSSDLYSIAIYDLTQKDVATRDPNIATATYIPAGKVHSQGVELEAHHQITPQLSTIASYTWNRLRFQDTKDGTDNNTPQLSPDQMASFWARYQFPAGISVGAGVRYIGKQWADDANTARLPSVTLMDAMMRADLGVWSPTLKGAYVQVNANNIGDREYISGCYGTGNCYWGAERSVIATVGYDF